MERAYHSQNAVKPTLLETGRTSKQVDVKAISGTKDYTCPCEASEDEQITNTLPSEYIVLGMEQHILDDSNSDTLPLKSFQYAFDHCECLISRLARQPIRQAVHGVKMCLSHVDFWVACRNRISIIFETVS